MSDGNNNADLLYGVPAIAGYLNMRERPVRHLCERGTIPTFKLGDENRGVCARKSALDAWLSEREAKARRDARIREAAHG